MRGVIEAVIFDFDGVLVESVDVKTQAFAKMFESYGPEVLRKVIDFHLAHGGMTRYDKFRYYYGELLQEPLSEDKLGELSDRFSQLVVDEVIAAPYVKGAEEFLERFCHILDLFVVSATPEEEIRHIVERRGMRHYFREVYGAPPTKLALTQDVLDRNGYEPAKVLFVGDALSDYEAAANSGCAFVGRVVPDIGNQFPKETITIRDLVRLAQLLGELGSTA